MNPARRLFDVQPATGGFAIGLRLAGRPRGQRFFPTGRHWANQRARMPHPSLYAPDLGRSGQCLFVEFISCRPRAQFALRGNYVVGIALHWHLGYCLATPRLGSSLFIAA
jgi:hypothetical protein